MKLSKERMEYIIDNKLIERCTEDEKKQVFKFAFGEEFMEQPRRYEKLSKLMKRIRND